MTTSNSRSSFVPRKKSDTSWLQRNDEVKKENSISTNKPLFQSHLSLESLQKKGGIAARMEQLKATGSDLGNVPLGKKTIKPLRKKDPVWKLEKKKDERGEECRSSDLDTEKAPSLAVGQNKNIFKEKSQSSKVCPPPPPAANEDRGTSSDMATIPRKGMHKDSATSQVSNKVVIEDTPERQSRIAKSKALFEALSQAEKQEIPKASIPRKLKHDGVAANFAHLNLDASKMRPGAVYSKQQIEKNKELSASQTAERAVIKRSSRKRKTRKRLKIDDAEDGNSQSMSMFGGNQKPPSPAIQQLSPSKSKSKPKVKRSKSKPKVLENLVPKMPKMRKSKSKPKIKRAVSSKIRKSKKRKPGTDSNSISADKRTGSNSISERTKSNSISAQRHRENNRKMRGREKSAIRYGSELAQMISMGFTHEKNNLKAIIRAKGDVQIAINLLIAHANRKKKK